MRWFKHMSFARNDEDMSEMIDTLGTESYGVWWIIVEMVAEQMDKSNKHSARFSFKKWAKSCGVSVKKFQKTVGFLSKLGKISVETSEKYPDFLKISIPKLLNFRDEWSKRSGVTTEQVMSDSGVTTEQETEAETETETESNTYGRVKKNKKKKIEYSEAFERWWKTYPLRNGQRVGKKKTFTYFQQIPKEEWENLARATQRYKITSDGKPKDPERFLRDEIWKDLLDYEENTKPILRKSESVFIDE